MHVFGDALLGHGFNEMHEAILFVPSPTVLLLSNEICFADLLFCLLLLYIIAVFGCFLYYTHISLLYIVKLLNEYE